MPPVIRINRDATIRREAISADHHCVVVDDFLLDPDELVEFAVDRSGEFLPAKSFYPGLFVNIDDDAMADIYRFIQHRMTKHFPFLRSKLKLSSFLAMATLQPDELSTIQRICHTDAALDSSRTPYAALIYVFRDERLGGTSFFRYRKRQELLKEVDALADKEPDKALAFLLKNFPTFRKPACYMTQSNEIADLLYTVPARFNRLIFYSGLVPHNAAITAPDLLSDDVRNGRLTLNVFADVLAR